MATDRLRQAKALIDQRRYVEARQLLENVPGDRADEWRRKLDDRLGLQPVSAVQDVPIPPPPMQPTYAPVYQQVRTYEDNEAQSGTTQAVSLLLGGLSVISFAILVAMAIAGLMNTRNLFNPINILAFIVVLGLAIVFRALKARL